jgi:hypothetical protein
MNLSAKRLSISKLVFSLFMALGPNLVSAQSAPLCRDLEIGERQRIFFSFQNSRTGLPIHYYLSRKSQSAYEVAVPILLRDNTSSSTAEGLKVVRAMKEKINQCLAEDQFYIPAPNNTKVILKALFPEENPQVIFEPSIDRIDIYHQVHPNTRQFPVGIGCDVIVHELLHRTGLVDEYPDYIGLTVDSSGAQDFGAVNNCRVEGPKESLMHSMADAYRVIKEISFEGLFKFSTNAGADENLRLTFKIDRFPVRNDLTVQKEAEEKADQRFWQILSLTEPEENLSKVQMKDKKVRSLDSQAAVIGLYPAQLRTIIYPGCNSKNALYYQCARHAHSGYQVECSVPTSCKNGQWLR